MSQEVLIILEGGLVQEVYGIPPDLVIRIKDYDVDGCDEDRLQRDRDGDAYCESVWTHEDSCGPAVDPA